MKSLSGVQLLATPWTAAYQTPPSMGFSSQEYWSGLPLFFPNNAINDVKSTLDGTNSKIIEAEDGISEVEDIMMEINEAERKKRKIILKHEDNHRDL